MIVISQIVVTNGDRDKKSTGESVTKRDACLETL